MRVTLTLTLDEELAIDIDALAKLENLSSNQYIIKIIKERIGLTMGDKKILKHKILNQVLLCRVRTISGLCKTIGIDVIELIREMESCGEINIGANGTVTISKKTLRKFGH